MVRHRTGRQLLYCEELGLVFLVVPGTQAIRRAAEVLCESFDCVDGSQGPPCDPHFI